MSEENGAIDFEVKGKGIDAKFLITTLLLVLNGIGVYTNAGDGDIKKELSELQDQFAEYKETNRFEMRELGFRVTHLEAQQKEYSN